MLIWASVPLLISMLKSIPALEILSISLLVSFFTTSLQLFFMGKLGKIRASLAFIGVGTFAVSVTSGMYIMAFKYAPPVHVELVMFVWPILVIVGNMLFLHEKVSLLNCLAVLLCVSALLSVHYENLLKININNSQYVGYLLVLCSSLTWTFYNIFARSFPNSSSELMGVYAGIGALFIIPLHFFLEKTVFPSFSQLFLIVLIGIFSQSFAYQAWDYAVKNVKPVIMTNIAYCTPIISILLLILCGFGEFTWYISLALALLVLASFLINFNRR